MRDIARLKETRAICLAAMSGNRKVDAFKTAESVNKLENEELHNLLPYISIQYEDSDQEHEDGVEKYAKYFKYLEEISKVNSQSNSETTTKEQKDSKD